MAPKSKVSLPDVPPLADATLRAYASDWAAFTSWCLLEKRRSLPAEPATVIAYLGSLARAHRLSSVRRKLVAIRQMHRNEGHDLDVTAAELGSMFSGEAARAPRPRAHLSAESLRKIVEAVPVGIAGLRDRAMILLLWSLRCRPAELVALDVGDVTLGRLKASFALKGRPGEPVDLRASEDRELCPVVRLRAWMSALEKLRPHSPPETPLFRGVTRFGSVLATRLSVQTIRLVLMRAALRAGVAVDELSADGLRMSNPAPAARGR